MLEQDGSQWDSTWLTTWLYPAVTSRVANEKAWNKGEFKGNLGENHCMTITDCDALGALSKREIANKNAWTRGQPMRLYRKTTWLYPAVTSAVAHEKAWNKGEFKGNLGDNHCMTLQGLEQERTASKNAWRRGQPMRFYLMTTWLHTWRWRPPRPGAWEK